MSHRAIGLILLTPARLEQLSELSDSILVIDIPYEREFVGAGDDILLNDTRRVAGGISEATRSANECKVSGPDAGG